MNGSGQRPAPALVITEANSHVQSLGSMGRVGKEESVPGVSVTLASVPQDAPLTAGCDQGFVVIDFRPGFSSIGRDCDLAAMMGLASAPTRGPYIQHQGSVGQLYDLGFIPKARHQRSLAPGLTPPQEFGLEARDMYARILCKRFKQGQGELVYAASPSLVGKRGTAARHALGRKQAMKEETPRTPCTCLARAAPLKSWFLVDVLT